MQLRGDLSVDWPFVSMACRNCAYRLGTAYFVESASTAFSFKRQKPANMLPIKQWKNAEIADGTGASGSPKALASSAPSPEFCMPTSMLTVRR